MTPLVGVLMGSDSDQPIMKETVAALQELGVPCELRVMSAHRTPDDVADYARGAAARGMKVIIAGAGGAAHLAGVIASFTTLPVIAVPIAGASGTLGGLDALLAMAQMPSGIPVATVAINGARNAGLLAAQIIATADRALAARLTVLRAKMADGVRAKDEKVRG
jgi:5-(carboxyamino)imidazole ribonucleotide mutase